MMSSVAMEEVRMYEALLLFVLWHHLWWNGAKLYFWILLSYRHIQCVAYLGGKIDLLKCSNASGDHEWPEDW